MRLENFLNKEYRKSKKIKIPELDQFSKKQHDKWSVENKSSEIQINGYKGQEHVLNKELGNYLNTVSPINAPLCNKAIIDYFKNQNHFIDGLPIYIIRRHGSRSGEIGSTMRRRGWLVRFNNAWIVYADNFFSRHFFEASYLVNDIDSAQIRDLVNSFSIPFSSGGGKYEKLHRAFPSLTHLTSKSGMYLSHIYDLNQNEYFINGKSIKAREILGRGADSKFGCGLIPDWDNGTLFQGKTYKYRVMRESLSEDELAFLTAYNIRMLSPYNYFPFPKTSLLVNSAMTGEAEEIRNYCQHFYESKYQESFLDYLENACVTKSRS